MSFIYELDKLFVRLLPKSMVGKHAPYYPMEAEMITSYRKRRRDVSRFHQEVVVHCFRGEDAGTVPDIMTYIAAGKGTLILLEEGKNVLGGAVVTHCWSAGKKIMMLTWLGVKEEHRGRNVGTRLVEAALSYARTNKANYLLAQVENPDAVEESSGQGNPLKRVEFYSRFGCKKLEVPCYVPAFTDDETPVTNLMLVMLPLTKDQETNSHITFPELPVFVEELLCFDQTEESKAFVEACKGEVALISLTEVLSKRS